MHPAPSAAAASTTTVDVQQVSVVYPARENTVTALDKVSLTIREGEFISLIGPSGCGKTTLLRVIADLEQVTSGEVRVNGMSPPEARLARAYGYVFQAPALFPWRTVLANVCLPLEIHGIEREAARRTALQHLERVGLKGFEGKYPWQLSGGMQQRVAIARALGFEPKLLMMDEPFGALDEITRDRLNEELRRVWRELGLTVLFVTHSIHEAAYLGQRVLMMAANPGRVRAIVPVDLPADRSLAMRETAPFVALAAELRRLLVTC